MHGIGNDFVLLDDRQGEFRHVDLSKLSQQFCDRRFGVGADGLLLIQKSTVADHQMTMLNPDGSISEMCGNGIRCFARYLAEKAIEAKPNFTVETGAGILDIALADDCVSVNMGHAGLTRGEIGMTGNPEDLATQIQAKAGSIELVGTGVSLGNPHLVFFETEPTLDLYKVGPKLEMHAEFPQRVNVHFVQIKSRDMLIQRTWERGAGMTLACGTGACASAVAAYVYGHSDRSVTVRLPGGNLQIEYRESGDVIMTGPAEFSFQGEFEPQLTGSGVSYS